MDDLLAHLDGRPRRRFADGDVLVAEGSPPGAVFVLVGGRVEVRRGGVVLARMSERGAVLGEISALTGAAATADVVARGDVEAVVVADAADALATDHALLLAVARTLAHRVRGMSAYLVDVQRQYAGRDGHLGVLGQVLGELMATPATTDEVGSERDDVPPY